MPTAVTPTVGRSVLYTLSDLDVASAIEAGRPGNPVHAGDVFPALILRTFGDTPQSAANLRVFLDGPGSGDLWVTSRAQGDGPAHWYAPDDTAAADQP